MAQMIKVQSEQQAMHRTIDVSDELCYSERHDGIACQIYRS